MEGTTLGAPRRGRMWGGSQPAGVITGHCCAWTTTRGVLERTRGGGCSAGRTSGSPAAGETVGGAPRAPFSHPALPSGSRGFLYARVYLTLVSSISTLIFVNIYLVCSRLQAKRLAWISSLRSWANLEEGLLFSL